MKKLFLLVGAALLGALVVTGPVRTEEKADRKDDKDPTIYRSVDLIGKAVRNNKNEALGYAEDFVVNMKDGHLIYVAVAYGETLGFGGKLFAVPPKALMLSEDGKAFTLNVNKEEFDKGQGFDANKWPMAADAKWATNKDEKPRENRKDDSPSKADDMHLRRLTSLMGLSVKNNQGEALGSAAGFGIDLKNEKVGYMVLSHGGVVGIAAKYFAIPWEALEMKSLALNQGRTFVLNAAKADFDNSPGFDYKNWPNRGDARFTKDGTKNK